MNDYININSFIKNYDNYNNNFDYNNSDDLFYNDFISNYQEIEENQKNKGG